MLIVTHLPQLFPRSTPPYPLNFASSCFFSHPPFPVCAAHVLFLDVQTSPGACWLTKGSTLKENWFPLGQKLSIANGSLTRTGLLLCPPSPWDLVWLERVRGLHMLSHTSEFWSVQFHIVSGGHYFFCIYPLFLGLKISLLYPLQWSREPWEEGVWYRYLHACGLKCELPACCSSYHACLLPHFPRHDRDELLLGLQAKKTSPFYKLPWSQQQKSKLLIYWQSKKPDMNTVLKGSDPGKGPTWITQFGPHWENLLKPVLWVSNFIFHNCHWKICCNLGCRAFLLIWFFLLQQV